MAKTLIHSSKSGYGTGAQEQLKNSSRTAQEQSGKVKNRGPLATSWGAKIGAKRGAKTDLVSHC